LLGKPQCWGLERDQDPSNIINELGGIRLSPIELIHGNNKERNSRDD